MAKKLITLISAALLVLTILVGCSCNSTKSIVNKPRETDANEPTKALPNIYNNSMIDGVYKNENYGYQLTVPAEIEDSIEIRGNDSIVYIYDKYIYEKYGEQQGLLANIFIDNAQQKIPYKKYKLLDTDGVANYILRYTEDSQYPEDDEKAKKSYEKCMSYIDKIADSFKLS